MDLITKSHDSFAASVNPFEPKNALKDSKARPSSRWMPLLRCFALLHVIYELSSVQFEYLGYRGAWGWSLASQSFTKNEEKSSQETVKSSEKRKLKITAEALTYLVAG
jgi:hypothetical protein